MKAVFRWSLVFLAGSISCTEVQEKILPDWLDIPVHVPDWWPLDIEKPDWFPKISNLTSAHPEWIPWPPQKPEHPEWIPWPPQKPEQPEWWPENLPWPPQHPESIQWPPQHPESIPWPPNKPKWWPDNLPWPPQHPEWIPWPPQKPVINKAVRGTPATIEEFPSLVQIEVGSGPIWAQGCAGSVLTNLHILTTATCVSGKYYSNRFRRIRAGSSTRFRDGTVIGVESVVVHPSFGNFKENFLDGDIAIVRLVSSLSFDSTIQQAQIVAPGFEVVGGLPVVLAGWGSTAQGKKISNHDLYKIKLVSIDNNSCADVWNSLIPISTVKVTSNMICVGQDKTGGRDADFRDNGAPIIYDNIVVGVVSWGNKLGNQRFPVVATAVSSYTNWILDNVV